MLKLLIFGIVFVFLNNLCTSVRQEHCYLNLVGVNMNINCLIFEDEAGAVANVSFMIGKHAPGWEIVGIASTIDDCKQMLETKQADVIFSDIHFGKEIIFNVLPELKQYRGKIIFISGDNGFAAQAFQLSASNYLLKPIDEIHFKETISRLRTQNIEPLQSNEVLFHNLSSGNLGSKQIAFNTNSGYVVKQISDIIYAKSSNNYTEIYFDNKDKVLVSKTMLEYEKMLENFGFLRIHQSYLVNFKYVLRFDTEDLLLHLITGDILPVSNRKKTVLLEMLRRIF